MHNVKNKSKHILTVALASLVVVATLSASIMAGCGEESSDTTETIAVTGTSIVTNVIEETYYTDENGNVVTENNESGDSANADNQNGESDNSSDNNSSDSSDSKTSNNSGSKDKSNTSEKSESGNSASNSDSDSDSDNNSDSSDKSNNSSYKKKKLTIGNKNYSVGDTVTCVYKLKAPENLEDFQAMIKYDSDYLKVKSAKMSGPAESGSVINSDLKEKIKFNGTNISFGYNYKREKDFVTVTYEVVSGGNTAPSFEWEVATGKSQTSYVKNGKATDLTITTSYS